MKGVAYTNFRPWMIVAHREAAHFVDSLRDKEEPLRCHEVARAAARWLDALDAPSIISGKRLAESVVDGHYGLTEHSWIRLAPRIVLDVYAVGRHPLVQLVDLEARVPHESYYKPGKTRTDIQETIVQELLRG